jgi:ribosomal protein L37AE/L43A
MPKAIQRELRRRELDIEEEEKRMGTSKCSKQAISRRKKEIYIARECLKWEKGTGSMLL